MTSTSCCTGIENIEKPTSRVLAPPGGKTNFSLGGYGEEQAAAAPKPSRAQPQQQPQAQQDLYKPSPPQPIRPAEDSFANLFGDEIIQKQVDNLPRGKRRFPSQTDIGHNPVTGEPQGQEGGASNAGATRGQRGKGEKMDPANMPAAGGRVETRAPIKRQPPGGKDSGIFS